MSLSTLRERAGLTQEELAKILGVTVQTISNWEQARAIPKLTIRQVITILTVLPCTLYDLGRIFDEIEAKAIARRKSTSDRPKQN